MGRRKQKQKDVKNHVQSGESRILEYVRRSCIVIPPNIHYLVFVVILAQRLYYVSQEDSWWILHPDEIFQSLEIAYSEYFGYGFRAYEYVPPLNRTEVSPMLERQQDLGMFSLRSFLLPTVFYAVIAVSEWIKTMTWLGVTPFIACKCFHATVAATLPLAVYRFAKVLYRSHELATLCCLAVVSSEILTELSTHTIVNSLLSPIVFYSLSNIFEIFLNLVDSDDLPVDDNMNYKPLCKFDHIISGENNVHVKDIEQKDDGDVSTITATDTNTSYASFYYIKRCVSICAICLSSLSRVSFSVRHSRIPGCMKTANGDQRLYKTVYGKQFCNENAPTVDKISTEGEARDEMKCINGQRTEKSTMMRVNELIDSSRDDISGRCAVCSDRDNSDVLSIANREKQMVFGFFIGLCMYVRVDLTAFVTLTGAPWVLRHCKPKVLLTFIYAACGCMLAILLGGYVDFCSYRTWFLSPRQWFCFNVVSNRSTLLFGGSNFNGYFQTLFRNNVINSFLLLCIIFVLLAGMFRRQIMCQTDIDQHHICFLSNTWITDVKLFISFSCLILMYSCHGHKETRFIYNCTVLFYIVATSAIYKICVWILDRRNYGCDLTAFKALSIVFLVAIFYNVKEQFSHQRQETWSYRSDSKHSHLNNCIYFLSQVDDIKGLFLDHYLYSTGGYTLLHKDIPIIARFTFEYFEYTDEGRMHLDNHLTSNIRVALTGKMSNIISIYNKLYLLDFLSETPMYNYYIVHRRSEFHRLNLIVVKEVGDWTVLKRPSSLTKNIFRKQIIDNIKTYYNETLFVYEAGLLLQYGLPNVAETRLNTVLQFTTKDVRVYQMLYEIYHTRKDNRSANSIMRRCFRDISANECKRWKTPIKLHNEYTLKKS